MRFHLTSFAAAVAIALMSVACAQTDAGITTAVKAKLAADNDVKAYQIDVDTNNKVVTLTGTVDTAVAKSRAVELARNTDGVASVMDRLMISVASIPATEPDAQRVAFTDPIITATLKSRLLADPVVSGLKIDVDTHDGTVTLTGQVRSHAEREQVLRMARETEGVKSVEDKLSIVP